MKQGISLSCSKLATLFSEPELSVAEVLLDLGTIISTSESGRPRLTWGRKRRRSSLDEGPPSSRAPSPSLRRPNREIELRNLQLKLKDDSAAAASPDTPLSFSPSESDDKPRHSSKKSSKEDYIEEIEALTRDRDSLIMKLENKRKHYNQLKSENSELKTKKQEVLKSYPIKEEGQMEIGKTVNLLADLTHHYRITVFPHHQQPFIADQKFQYSLGPIPAQFYPSANNGPKTVNHMGPCGIPDLNISAEEACGVDPSQPSDMGRVIADRRARSAEARRMRKGIIRIKSIRSACGIKLPRLR